MDPLLLTVGDFRQVFARLIQNRFLVTVNSTEGSLSVFLGLQRVVTIWYSHMNNCFLSHHA